MDSITLEAPNELPHGMNLSHSSIDLFLRCPEKWRRRYIEHQYEPPVGIQILGRAVHAAEAHSYTHQIDTGHPHGIEQVLDDFRTTVANEAKSEAHIDWQDDSLGVVVDRGTGMLRTYHKAIVPAIRPSKVEHPFEVRLHPDYKWVIRGYIDVVASYDDGFFKRDIGPHDLKTVKRKGNQGDLDASLQATLYTIATIQPDEEKSTFVVHEIKDKESRIVETVRDRTSQQRYLARVAMVARQIESNMQTGDWQGAPPAAWWCRESACGFWASCPLAERGSHA